jgi:hypothetical protein
MRYAEIALRSGSSQLAASDLAQPGVRARDRVATRRVPGRLAQRESASFTPRRSLVRSQYRPPRGLDPFGGPRVRTTWPGVGLGRRRSATAVGPRDSPHVRVGRTRRGYAFEPLMAWAYSRPLYQPHDEHAVCGSMASRQRGQVVSVGALAFHWARRDRVLDRDFFHLGVRPPVMSTFSSSCGALGGSLISPENRADTAEKMAACQITVRGRIPRCGGRCLRQRAPPTAGDYGSFTHLLATPVTVRVRT